MTKSVENPLIDFRTNVIGTLNILEAIRKFSPQTMFFNISSNKVYGDALGRLVERTKIIRKL